MSQQPQFTPRPKNPMDIASSKIYGDNGEKGMATIQFQALHKERDGMGYRIQVYTNIESDKENQNGAINGDLDVLRYQDAITMLEQAIAYKPKGDNDKDFVLSMPLKRQKFMDKKPVKGEYTTDATFSVGKRENGMIWIALSKYKRPNIQFELKAGRLHSFVKRGGEPLSEPEISEIAAKSLVRYLTTMGAIAQDRLYKEPPKRDFGGGNNNGNRNGGNGYGGKPSYNTDDDIPY
jgi:hypothetical protein